MPDDNDLDVKADNLASKRSKRKLLMDTASRVVTIIQDAATYHDDLHYVMDLVYVLMQHEEPCSDAHNDGDDE